MIEFLDGFDHYDNTFLGYKWTSADTSSGFGIDAGRGRFGSKGYQAGGARALLKTLPGGSLAERVWGNAIYFHSVSDGSFIMYFTDAGTTQCELGLSGGRVVATRNGTLIPGAVGTTPILSGVWYYIEFRVLVGNAGEVEVRVNGNVEFNLSGVDTQNTANATANGIAYHTGTPGGNTIWIDDVYITDTVDNGGPHPNDSFLGDIRVPTILPNGNGASSVFDGSDGNSTDNYLLVDETVPDSDTTYVEENGVGDKDTYAYSDVSSAAGTVYGIQTMPFARKTDSGTREIVVVTRESGGTEEDGSNLPLSASYVYLFDIREQDPDGNGWTPTSINAAEFGVKIAA